MGKPMDKFIQIGLTKKARKAQTGVSRFSFYHKHILTVTSQEKEMATHSSIFAWRIPWIQEPDRL